MLNDQPHLQEDLLVTGKLLTRWVRDGTILGCALTLDD
jgi:hypothetical protein